MQPQEVLPLRVYSTMAISRTLERFIAITTIPPLSSSIRWILETILELIEVIATDELIPGLQTIVSLLAPEEVAKHAIHLCQHLGTLTYHHLVTQCNPNLFSQSQPSTESLQHPPALLDRMKIELLSQ